LVEAAYLLESTTATIELIHQSDDADAIAVGERALSRGAAVDKLQRLVERNLAGE
jgi:hypothetical protein